MEFFKYVGETVTTDRGTVAGYVASKGYPEQDIGPLKVGSIAFVTDLETGEVSMEQYVGDSTKESTFTSWHGWITLQ